MSTPPLAGHGQTERMSLHAFHTRLIWLCMGPLVLLAAFLAINNVLTSKAERDLEARNIAQNFATAIDQHLTARIGAMNMLAISPQVDDPIRRQDLYREAQGFQRSFDTHIILANLQGQMLFNTRNPFGAALPRLPAISGRAAAPVAIRTGKPAVGDAFFGSIAKVPLVAIAVPVLREERVSHLLLATMEARQFQQRLDQVSLPSGWSLALCDSIGGVIARRAPLDMADRGQLETSGRFVVRSTLSSWSVILDIPTYNAPLYAAALSLLAAIAAATLIGMLGGALASRRLSRSVAALVAPRAPGTAMPEIIEIARVRALLDETADQRTQAESAQSQSEQRFRATFEQAAMGIALVAPDGGWLRVNQKICEIVGYPQEELLTLTFQDITHPDDLHSDLGNLQKVLAGEISTYSMEKRYFRKDGAIIWINLTVSLVRKADGSPDYFISVVEDIQRRIEAEQAIRDSAAALQEAQRMARIGSWEWDVLNDVHYWSDEIYRIYGRDPSLGPAAYPEVQTYFTEESWLRLAAAVERGMTQGSAYACDAEVRRSDGGRRWITVRGEVLRDAAGQVQSLHGMVQDITERKQAELNDLQKQNTITHLSRVSMLGELSGALAHELNQPLMAILGNAQAAQRFLAREPIDLDEVREILTDIVDEDRRASEVITRLRMLLRSGEIRREAVELDQIILEVGKLLRSDLINQNVELRFEFADAGAVVYADPIQLQQVLINLIKNACGAMSDVAPSERWLIVRSTLRAPDAMQISVIDRGPGIPAAALDKLFDAFFTTKADGMGLGLSICRSIMEAHEGALWCVNNAQGGATFHFSVPLHRRSAP